MLGILLRILEERKIQDLKWGTVPRLGHDFGKWLVILMEEIGEASRAELEGDWLQSNKELLEAAAVIVAWIEHLEIVQENRTAT